MTDEVAESEELARGVFDSTVAKKARKEQMLPSAFMEREGVCTLSVLRTSIIANDAEVVRIGRHMARNRGPNRTIYGWFMVSARSAGEAGAYGVTFPDLPGIAAMGEAMDDALLHAEEALRDYVTETEADGARVAEASPIERVSPPEGATLVSIPLIRLPAARCVRT